MLDKTNVLKFFLLLFCSHLNFLRIPQRPLVANTLNSTETFSEDMFSSQLLV